MFDFFPLFTTNFRVSVFSFTHDMCPCTSFVYGLQHKFGGWGKQQYKFG